MNVNGGRALALVRTTMRRFCTHHLCLGAGHCTAGTRMNCALKVSSRQDDTAPPFLTINYRWKNTTLRLF
jgi:hypothetical protein